MNSEKLHKALGIFLEEMRNFLVQFIEKHYPNEDWFEVFYERLGEAQQNSWELTLQSKDKERKEFLLYENCKYSIFFILLQMECENNHIPRH